MSPKEYFVELFAFTRTERKGILVLTTAIVLLIAWRLTAGHFFTPDPPDLAAHRQGIDAWLTTLGDSLPAENNSTGFVASEVRPEPVLFFFDPNTISDAEWLQLGLSERDVRGIRNYLAKGGQFRKPGDLARMYTIDSLQYKRLAPYIRLATPGSDEHTGPAAGHATAQEHLTRQSYPDYSSLRIEINSADTAELKKLRGIGSFLAKKIVEYRTKLGGFHDLRQLAEVYRLTAGKVDTLSANLLLDVSLVKKINVNTATANDLSAHPYLTSAQAKSLVAIREMHGPFRRPEDLKRSALMDENTFQKIIPYLGLE